MTTYDKRERRETCSSWLLVATNDLDEAQEDVAKAMGYATTPLVREQFLRAQVKLTEARELLALIVP